MNVIAALPSRLGVMPKSEVQSVKTKVIADCWPFPVVETPHEEKKRLSVAFDRESYGSIGLTLFRGH